MSTARSPCGFLSTVLYVPGTGTSLSSCSFLTLSYWPAGTTHVAAATTAISAKRMVYAVGNLKPCEGAATGVCASETVAKVHHPVSEGRRAFGCLLYCTTGVGEGEDDAGREVLVQFPVG